MNKYTIALDQFDARYDKNYMIWLKRDIKSISSPVQNSCRNVEDKEAKTVIEVGEVKWKAQEMHAKFLQNQCVLENTIQELEKLRRNFYELDLWVKDKLIGIQYEDWVEKEHQSKVLILDTHFNNTIQRKAAQITAIRDDIVMTRIPEYESKPAS